MNIKKKITAAAICLSLLFAASHSINAQAKASEIDYKKEFLIASSISAVQTKYGENLKKATQAGEEGSITEIYQLFKAGKLIVEITPDAENEKNIGEITIFDPSYKNVKGAGIGTSISEFAKIYPDMEIGYTYVSDRFIVQSSKEKFVQFELNPKDYIGNKETLTTSDWIVLAEKNFIKTAKIKSVRIYGK